MFECNWRTSASVGLPLIAAFAVCGFLLGNQLGYETGNRDAHTKEYERHAADEIERTCLRLDAVAEAECIVRVINTAHEHKRAENDLIAQRNMARWALFMLLATLAMAAITAGGVYYVWRTLGVTREIGQAQVRAYLSVESAEFKSQNDRFIVSCNVINSGLSPAKKIRVEGVLCYNGVSFIDTRKHNRGNRVVVGPGETDTVTEKCSDIMAGCDAFVDFAFGDPVDLPAVSVISQGRMSPIFIKCQLVWTDVFDKEHPLEFCLSGFRKDKKDENANPDPAYIRQGSLIVTDKPEDVRVRLAQL